jgi:hypothetical protein
LNTKPPAGGDGAAQDLPPWLARRETNTMPSSDPEQDHAAALKAALVRFRHELVDWLSSRPELSSLDLNIMPDGETTIAFCYRETDTAPESPLIWLTLQPQPEWDY